MYLSKVQNVFVQIDKKKYLSEKESKYFGGLCCRCVQLTCKVWTPSTSLDGDARYKTLKLFPWKPFRQYFGGNLITYWFNLIFVWNGICTAFNRGGAIGSEFNWGRPGTSPVKILSINIAINLDHRFIKYPSTNQSTNQYPSILPTMKSNWGFPWKHFPPISAICSFKPEMTTIGIKNWNLDQSMNWVEIDWEGESFSFALTDLCHQIEGLSKGGITRPKQWKDKKTQTMTMTMAMTMTAMSALMMIAMTMAQWFNETACRSWSFVTWFHFPNLQTSNLSVDSHSLSSAWWGWWAEGGWG